MKQKFSQSYSKREEALFTKMRSRRLQRWYNNRLSKIDSQERIWLIIFTKPYKENAEWNLKFWVWNSEDNTILGENILHGYSNPETPRTTFVLGNNLLEGYIEKRFEYVVFRPIGCRALLVFNFVGKLIIQTEELSLHLYEKEVSFSKFLSKDILFSNTGGSTKLYYLNEFEGGILPLSVKFMWNNKAYPKDGDINVIFQDKWCVIAAYDESAETASSHINAIWVYRRDSFGTNDFEFVAKLGLSRCPHNIEAREIEKYFVISFQNYSKDAIKERKMEWRIPNDFID